MCSPVDHVAAHLHPRPLCCPARARQLEMAMGKGLLAGTSKGTVRAYAWPLIHDTFDELPVHHGLPSGLLSLTNSHFRPGRTGGRVGGGRNDKLWPLR